MLNSLIVDDEAPARKRLGKLLKPLEENGRLNIVGEAVDGVDALQKVEDEPIDLLFLDIQMPEMDGFDLLAELHPEERPAVIFITAYDQYALQAFEENAVDYLLKPIKADRLEEAVERAEKRFDSPEMETQHKKRLQKLIDWLYDEDSDEPEPATEELSGDDSAEYPQQITVSYNDRIRVVPLENVVSIEIEDGVTRLFVLSDGDSADETSVRHHVIDYTLDHLETALNPDSFKRVHRSALVQTRFIEEMVPWFSGRYKLIMRGDHEVVASRKRSKELKNMLTL